jgi:hypothetical protein
MYGIYSTCRRKFQFGICEPTGSKSLAKLESIIGKDSYKWRFVAKILPKADAQKYENQRHCPNNGKQVNTQDLAREQGANHR